MAGQLSMTTGATATAKHGVLMASLKASALHHQHPAAAASARMQLPGRENSARRSLSLRSRSHGRRNNNSVSRRTMAMAALGASSAAVNAAVVDRTIEIKITIARGTGKLDLTELDTPLTEIPSEVFELTELIELSVAGNRLTSLPADIAKLTNLEKLQVAGNCLEELPEELGQLQQLDGLWVHGNLLRRLPESICMLENLRTLSLAGNRLEVMPAELGSLAALEDLGLPGNLLQELPESLGKLKSLRKLSLHGNRLKRLPDSLGDLAALEELWLMGNDLVELPASVGNLSSVKQLSVADNALVSVPDSIAALSSLASLWLYGNELSGVPAALAQMPSLRNLWLEGNPLHPSSVEAFLRAVPDSESLKAVGLDDSQVAALDPSALSAAIEKEVLEISRIAGKDRAVAAAAADTSASATHHASRGYFKLKEGTQFQKEGSPKVLVVAFGSAPGVPNWAGLLRRVGGEAEKSVAGRFDVLYVVDACRSWYGGGDGEDMSGNLYYQRLCAATEGYDEVIMVGDSMGATAALLFSSLATSAHAFCPQVDLVQASIRPGQPAEWLASLKGNLMAALGSSSGDVTVHCGNWQHDLDQAVMVEPHTELLVYDFSSHRLALYLDSSKKLLPIVRDTIFGAMREKGSVRLSNLL